MQSTKYMKYIIFLYLYPQILRGKVVVIN